MHTLRYVSPTNASVCEIQPVRCCTLHKLEISFQYVTNTLQNVCIRCHTAKRSYNFVHSYTLDISLTYVGCTLHVSYAYVKERYMHNSA